MARMIDAGSLRDNITDIYGDVNRLVYLKDVLGLIDEQPTLTLPNEPLTLEQLREMEGQWIIIKAFDADISGIMPAFIKDQFATTLCELGSKAIVPDLCEVHFSFNEYGKTWLAYHHPQRERRTHDEH